MFKILVVEDDADLNRSVCSFLNMSGYEATGCLGAAQAYDAMYETVFDLIVSDIMMPNFQVFGKLPSVEALGVAIWRLRREVSLDIKMKSLTLS